MQTIQRTIRIKLCPSPEQATLLSQTVELFTKCFNQVVEVAERQKLTNGVELHKLTYAKLRASTSLPSQLICAARVKATEAIKSVFALRKKAAKIAKASGKTPKPIKPPKSRSCAIRYDARSYWFERESRTVSLVHVKQPGQRNNRTIVCVFIPTYFERYLGSQWQTDSADLIRRKDGSFWLHVVVSTTVAEAEDTGHSIGIDLGISRIAVSSDNRFFGGKAKKEINNRYFRLRRALQTKGTKSAKRHLKKLSGRLARFQADVNHCVSKQLVAGCAPGDTIAMEDLTHIRERVKGRRQQRRAMYNWSFRQLQSFISYKALAVGIRLQFVDARYSSQGCSLCQIVDKRSRKNQSEFRCKHCGFQLNADLNASRNLASRAKGVAGRVPSITLASQLTSVS